MPENPTVIYKSNGEIHLPFLRQIGAIMQEFLGYELRECQHSSGQIAVHYIVHCPLPPRLKPFLRNARVLDDRLPFDATPIMRNQLR